MADRELRIRIGAAIDASFSQVMTNVVDAVKRARKQIQADVSASAKAMATAEVQASKEIQKAQDATVKSNKAAQNAMTKDVEAASKERARQAKEMDRMYKQLLKDQERAMRDHAKEEVRIAKDAAKEKAAEDRRQKNRNRDLSRGGALLMRAGAAAIGTGARFLGSALHGIGVDASAGGQLAGAANRESLAVDIASQGYIGSGKGPAGSQTYASSDEILAQATDVGIKTGTETANILEGVENFVKMTGDLKTARDTMADIGKIAKANGADFSQMMEAAANVSISMGEVPHKAEQVAAIMRVVAGQGHLGAVTIKDLATQMGKLTGQAKFFKIDPLSARTLTESGVTDETTQRVAVMGAMTQYARAKGGRTSAKQAAQSAMAFIRDMSSASEVKNLAKHGINAFTDNEHTQVRDPMQIIMEVFKQGQKRGGIGQDILRDVFRNQQSRAVANAMLQDYDAAYQKAAQRGITDETKKHQAAMQELSDTFQNYLKVTQSASEVELKFTKAMDTAKSKANILNNQLGKLADEGLRTLLPIVVDLAPAMLELLKTVVSFVGEITGNKPEEGKVDNKIAQQNAELIANHVRLTAKATPGQMFGGSEQLGAEYAQAEKDLEAAIARKEKRVTEDKGAETIFGKKILGNMSEDEIERRARGESGPGGYAPGDDRVTEFAKKYVADRDELAKMRRQLDDLHAARKEAADAFAKALHERPIQVKVVNPSGAVRPATSGTASGDSDDLTSHEQ